MPPRHRLSRWLLRRLPPALLFLAATRRPSRTTCLAPDRILQPLRSVFSRRRAPAAAHTSARGQQSPTARQRSCSRSRSVGGSAAVRCMRCQRRFSTRGCRQRLLLLAQQPPWPPPLPQQPPSPFRRPCSTGPCGRSYCSFLLFSFADTRRPSRTTCLAPDRILQPLRSVFSRRRASAAAHSSARGQQPPTVRQRSCSRSRSVGGSAAVRCMRCQRRFSTRGCRHCTSAAANAAAPAAWAAVRAAVS